MKFLQAGALLATLLLSACGESSQTFLVDNPTDAPLTIRMDGQAHTIPANASSELKLAPGAHALHSEPLGEVRFIVYAGGKRALINPTLSDYIIANQIYVTDDSKLDNFRELQHTVTLDGVEFTGPFKQSHDLFIAQDWDFGLRKPFPETQVTMDVPKSGGNFYSKIFTAPEFIAYYETGYDQPGYFTRQRPGGFVQPRHALERPSTTLPTLVPEYEAHAGPLRDVYARYLKATEPKEQLQLQKAFFNAMMAYTAATATLGANLPVEANQANNEFVTRVSTAIGETARVID